MKNKNNNETLSNKDTFISYPNLQRPKEKYYFNEETKEVKNDKGEIVGSGRIVNKTLIINFKGGKHEN